MIEPPRIRALVMDREFIGKKWLGWLEQRGVGYVVRLKHNALVGGMHASQLSRRGRWKRCASRRFGVFGQQVFFAAKNMTAQHGGALQVISNCYCAAEALELYRMRWGVEVFFSHLKTRGLNLEQTHLSAPERIERLMAVLAVAFAIAHRHGAALAAKRAVATKKHGFAAKSIFHLGLEDIIRTLFSGSAHLLANLLLCIQFSTTFPAPLFVV